MSAIVAFVRQLLPTSWLTLVVTLLVVYAIHRWLSYKRQFASIPQPKGLPVLGNLFEFMGNPLRPDGLQIYQRTHKILMHVTKEFANDGVVAYWILHKPLILLFSAPHIEKLLTSNTEITKGHDYDYLRPWLFDGLLMSRGKRWKSRRRLISPAFHFTIINDFVPTFVECGEKLCVELNRQRASNQNVIEHLMNPIEICALQIICQTSIGVSLESIKSGDKDRVGLDYTRTLAEITHVAFERSLNPVMDCDFLFYCTGRGRQFQKNIDRMKSFMDHVIKERIQKRNELKKAKKTNNNNDDDSGSGKNSESLVNEEQPYFYGKLKRKRAFLDLLVDTMLDQAGQTVSAEEKLDLHAIREEVNTFTFEGFDTTSTTLFATIYLLGLNPEAQQKAYEEVMEVIGSSNDLFDLDSISRLKYVEACIKEALRVIPTVPIIMRALQANFKLDNGTVLPAGSQVYISLIGLHSSETYYDNPTEYRPERFYGQDDRGQSSFTFVPFSAGPRNCIGQKFAMTDMKVIVSILLRRYRFESLLPFEEFHPKIEVVTKPSQKTPVRLHDRQ